MGLAPLPPPHWLDMRRAEDRQTYRQELIAERDQNAAGMRWSITAISVAALVALAWWCILK
jgi:hypothetical protein